VRLNEQNTRLQQAQEGLQKHVAEQEVQLKSLNEELRQSANEMKQLQEDIKMKEVEQEELQNEISNLNKQHAQEM